MVFCFLLLKGNIYCFLFNEYKKLTFPKNGFFVNFTILRLLRRQNEKFHGFSVFHSQAEIGQHAVLFNEYKAAVVDS